MSFERKTCAVVGALLLVMAAFSTGRLHAEDSGPSVAEEVNQAQSEDGPVQEEPQAGDGQSQSAAALGNDPESQTTDGDNVLREVLVAPDESTFTGAARYRIPIKVPPGRSGIAPDLALIYNSFRRNGWVGVGWDLTPMLLN